MSNWTDSSPLSVADLNRASRLLGWARSLEKRSLSYAQYEAEEWPEEEPLSFGSASNRAAA